MTITLAKRGREGKAKKKKCSEQQTTTNAIHKSKNPQDNKDRQQHTTYIASTNKPQSPGQCRKRWIMTQCNSTPQKKKNRTTSKTLRNNKQGVMIILPHGQNSNRINNARNPNTKYDKLPPTQFEGLQQAVIWRQIIAFWRQSPNLRFFLADQCRHDHVSTVKSLNCHDGQVDKLCRHWTSTFLY